MVRDKESAGEAHKRGGSMIFSDRQLSKIYLDICEQFTGKKRDTIRKEFDRNKLDTSSMEDLEIYLRNRVVEIPPKVVERLEEKVGKKFGEVAGAYIEEEKKNLEGGMTPGQIKMAEIMKKINSSGPGPAVTLTIQPKGTYYGKLDENGFYED